MVHLDGGGQAAELCICLCVRTVIPITLLEQWDTSSCVLGGVWHLEHTVGCVNTPRSKKGGRKGMVSLLFQPGQLGSLWICRFMDM